MSVKNSLYTCDSVLPHNYLINKQNCYLHMSPSFIKKFVLFEHKSINYKIKIYLWKINKRQCSMSLKCSKYSG